MALKHLPSYISFLPPNLRKRAKRAFFYTAEVIPLAVNAVATPTIPIEADSAFQFTSITGTVRDPAAPQTAFPFPAITIQINDSGSGRNLLRRPTDWHNIVGTAQLPGDFEYPYFAKAAGEFTVTLQNLSGLQAYDVRLTFRGFKVFGFDDEDADYGI